VDDLQIKRLEFFLFCSYSSNLFLYCCGLFVFRCYGLSFSDLLVHLRHIFLLWNLLYFVITFSSFIVLEQYRDSQKECSTEQITDITGTRYSNKESPEAHSKDTGCCATEGPFAYPCQLNMPRAS
jgi:hypothetical protein